MKNLKKSLFVFALGWALTGGTASWAGSGDCSELENPCQSDRDCPSNSSAVTFFCGPSPTCPGKKSCQAKVNGKLNGTEVKKSEGKKR